MVAWKAALAIGRTDPDYASIATPERNTPDRRATLLDIVQDRLHLAPSSNDVLVGSVPQDDPYQLKPELNYRQNQIWMWVSCTPATKIDVLKMEAAHDSSARKWLQRGIIPKEYNPFNQCNLWILIERRQYIIDGRKLEYVTPIAYHGQDYTKIHAY